MLKFSIFKALVRFYFRYRCFLNLIEGMPQSHKTDNFLFSRFYSVDFKQRNMSEVTLLIQTEYGQVKGCKKTSALGSDYFNFQRIPYMKPLINEVILLTLVNKQDAQPPEPWNEPLDCTKEGPAFCNINHFTHQYEGELDAMFINIFSKSIDPQLPLSVMVFI